MSEQPSEPWIPPEWRDQMTRDTEMLQAMAGRALRRAFLRGLATGISGTVILAVVVWSLWP